MVAAILPPVVAIPITTTTASTVRAPKAPSLSPTAAGPSPPLRRTMPPSPGSPHPKRDLFSLLVSLLFYFDFHLNFMVFPFFSTHFVQLRPQALPLHHRSRPNAGAHGGEDISSTTAKAVHTTTRSLSVSFQGKSFSFQTSKAKPAASPSHSQKPTPDRRHPAGAPARSEHLSENSKPFNHCRWPVART